MNCPLKPIKVKDSTRFQIPESLSAFYPGCGGSGSKAGVFIQFEYDLLSGKVQALDLTDAKRADSTDAVETIQQVQKGELIIRDLGYFTQQALNGIIKQEAYFVTRPKSNVIFYDAEKQTPIDLQAQKRYMKRHQIPMMELMVTSNQLTTPVRLVLELVPEQVLADRIRKAKQEAKRRGYQPQKSYENYLAFNLFLTNADQSLVTSYQIRQLYRARWQIELRFKAWKSFCKLHKLKKVNRYRFETYLYAKLLYILIHWELIYHMFLLCWEQYEELLSIHKAFQFLARQYQLLRYHLHTQPEKLKQYVIDLYGIATKNWLTEHKKKREKLQDLILINSCKSDK